MPPEAQRLGLRRRIEARAAGVGGEGASALDPGRPRECLADATGGNRLWAWVGRKAIFLPLA